MLKQNRRKGGSLYVWPKPNKDSFSGPQTFALVWKKVCLQFATAVALNSTNLNNTLPILMFLIDVTLTKPKARYVIKPYRMTAWAFVYQFLSLVSFMLHGRFACIRRNKEKAFCAFLCIS